MTIRNSNDRGFTGPVGHYSEATANRNNAGSGTTGAPAYQSSDGRGGARTQSSLNEEIERALYQRGQVEGPGHGDIGGGRVRGGSRQGRMGADTESDSFVINLILAFAFTVTVLVMASIVGRAVDLRKEKTIGPHSSMIIKKQDRMF